MTIKKTLWSFFNKFTVQKLLTVRDKKIGVLYRCCQIAIVIFFLYDLFMKDLYFKTEIPSGFTTMWAETGTLYDKQSAATDVIPDYCNNPKYNYIYSLPYWDHRDNDCINMHYSEMYQKGESEMFFMTYFTENNIELGKCGSFDNSTCAITGKLDGKCFCQNYKNFFTNGVEGMILAFNHLYATTFETGSNIGSGKITSIRTVIRNAKSKDVFYDFPAGQTIKLSVEDWLNVAGVSLENYNIGAIQSQPGENVTHINPPIYRISGVEIILKNEYSNIEHQSSYEKPVCIINVQANIGWASKGSHLEYINYPNLVNNKSYSDKIEILNGSSELPEDEKEHFVDRYRYGIKFKFIVSGLMGKFDWYMLLNYFVYTFVMLGTADTIVTNIVSYGLGDYSKIFNKLRTQEESLDNVKKTNRTIGRIKRSITSSGNDGIFRRRSRNNYNLDEEPIENVVNNGAYSREEPYNNNSNNNNNNININSNENTYPTSSLNNVTIDNTTQTIPSSQSDKSTQSRSIRFQDIEDIQNLNSISTIESTSESASPSSSHNSNNIEIIDEKPSNLRENDKGKMSNEIARQFQEDLGL